MSLYSYIGCNVWLCSMNYCFLNMPNMNCCVISHVGLFGWFYVSLTNSIHIQKVF